METIPNQLASAPRRRSSVVEQGTHKPEVAGSNPAAATGPLEANSLPEPPFDFDTAALWSGPDTCLCETVEVGWCACPSQHCDRLDHLDRDCNGGKLRWHTNRAGSFCDDCGGDVLTIGDRLVCETCHREHTWNTVPGGSWDGRGMPEAQTGQDVSSTGQGNVRDSFCQKPC